MTGASLLRRASDGLAARLDPGERVLAAAFAWVATPRPRVPLLFLARRPHWLAITDRRVILVRRPHRGEPPSDADVVVDAPLDAVEVVRARGLHPLLQLRVRAPGAPDTVVELRPRDRRVGLRLLGAATPAAEER